MFDTKTLEDWSHRGISQVLISFVPAGCEGTKLVIGENPEISSIHRKILSERGIDIYALENEGDRLASARITRVGSKWILASAAITSRCGCGSSFSFERKLISREKLLKLKKKSTPCHD